jgi:MoCo/4Fe-4S cofactor protein with predicted Tat translocation signal
MLTHNTTEHNHDHESEEILAQKKAARPQIERSNEYWVNLEQYNNDPEFWKAAETEFQSSPLRGEKEEGWARREFLKLMGASVAMTTAGCIRRPVQKIVPYAKQPEEVVLGMANYYTASFHDGLEPLSVLVKTKEGRPLKIEGLAEAPLTGGGTSARSQAALMSLYDPERLKGPRKNLFNEKRTNKDTIQIKWDDLDDQITEQLKKGQVAVLTGSLPSPSTRSIIKEFCQAFGGEHFAWEPLNLSDLSEGQKLSYGQASVPYYHFDQARVIVSIDADFLGAWHTPVANTRQFSKGRKNLDKMTRLVVFDSNYSLTGANADIRYKIKPSDQIKVAMGLAYEIVVKKGQSSYASNSSVKSTLEKFANAAQELGLDASSFAQVAQDLWENKGQSLVVAGGLPTLTGQHLDLQVAVNFLNSVLGNDGQTVNHKQDWSSSLSGSWSDLKSLLDKMNAGQVKTLILHKSNPVYSLPSSFGFDEALKKVEMVITTSDRMDEVAEKAHYIAPDNHSMESWGDAELTQGLIAIHQPTLRPLWDTRSFQLSLMTWAYLANKGPKRLLAYESYFDYLKNYWKEEIFPNQSRGRSFEAFWQDLLQDGFTGEAPKETSSRTFRVEALSQVKPQVPSGDYELVLYPTVQLGDGTQSNIALLQELPDPVTKIVWDNYVSASIGTAEKLKCKEGDLVRISVNAIEMTLPLHIQPGLHDQVLAVAVGYGRTHGGSIANGVGQNSYRLATVKAQPQFAGQSVSIVKLGKRTQLATTAGHHSMEGRQIINEATLADFKKDQAAGLHKHHIWSIWSGHQYNGNKWGLAVDLNSCTGCSACMVACSTENNVPSVGKKYVLEGREMHWIRIDRYYKGDPSQPNAVFQPVMCQHCDNAPCETVCPVLATVHSDEGTNDMAYNRCVGTRYCSNNCPYKVRRFNWFNYRKEIPAPSHMAFNPDVTVRMRGVMEKCTFCIQRIRSARSAAKLESRKLKDGDVKTACQTACPTEALIFGDMNDPNSKVSKAFAEPRTYGLLEEWGAKPSVRYMTKIRNNGKESAAKGDHS